MKKIREYARFGLKWSQPAYTRRFFELRSEDSLVGTLAFRSSFGTFAEAESGEGHWTFKRIGFWQNRASIREKGSERDLALFVNNTWSQGGTLSFEDGREFRATTNFWMTALEFRSPQDELLVRFDHDGVLKLSAEVTVTDLGATTGDLPLLVLFGWYLVIMLRADAAVVTTAAIG